MVVEYITKVNEIVERILSEGGAIPKVYLEEYLDNCYRMIYEIFVATRVKKIEIVSKKSLALMRLETGSTVSQDVSNFTDIEYKVYYILSFMRHIDRDMYQVMIIALGG